MILEAIILLAIAAVAGLGVSQLPNLFGWTPISQILALLVVMAGFYASYLSYQGLGMKIENEFWQPVGAGFLGGGFLSLGITNEFIE